MADNFLEKKMEELRKGSFSRSTRPASAPRKGFIRFPFPPRNVIIADLSASTAHPIIAMLRKADCKIAFISSDVESGENLAYNEGVRFIRASFQDNQTVRDAFDNVIKAWRETDIIITSARAVQILAEKWEEHLLRFPMPRPYGGRFFIINPRDKEAVDHITQTLSTRSITVNSFQLTGNDPEKISAIPPIIMALSLQSSAPISGLLF